MAFRATGNTVINDAQNGKFNAVTYRNFFSQKSQAQGANFGFVRTGGSIARFPFAADSPTSTVIGTYTTIKLTGAGQSSHSHGYISGGNSPALPGTLTSTIERFPFVATSGATSSVGNLVFGRAELAGQSSTSHGYTSGGTPSDPLSGRTVIIDRFPFVVDVTNATDVGDLSVKRSSPTGQSSTTHGYNTCGRVDPLTMTNVIDRFPFAVSTTNAVDVGDSTVARRNGEGISSQTHGYAIVGDITPAGTPSLISTMIERFSFSINITNAVDVGDLTVVRFGGVGNASLISGYYSGGSGGTPATAAFNLVQKFPFAVAVTNATNVGNLTGGPNENGHQY